MNYTPGELVRSLAGHDKGCIYMIFGTDGDELLLCDGRLKKVGSPKKKNIRHVQLIHTGSHPIMEALKSGREVTDEEVRHFVKAYGGNECLNQM